MWIQGHPRSPIVLVDCQFVCCLSQSFIDQFQNGVNANMSMNQNLKIAWVVLYSSKRHKTKVQLYVSKRKLEFNELFIPEMRWTIINGGAKLITSKDENS
jgi:hypothetical protein